MLLYLSKEKSRFYLKDRNKVCWSGRSSLKSIIAEVCCYGIISKTIKLSPSYREEDFIRDISKILVINYFRALFEEERRGGFCIILREILPLSRKVDSESLYFLIRNHLQFTVNSISYFRKRRDKYEPSFIRKESTTFWFSEKDYVIRLKISLYIFIKLSLKRGWKNSVS